MGDISRHRDIYLFTKDAVPTQLLSAARITAGDLTYLELGNYLTDVSQFRDPVTYIFAKQRIWRDNVLPLVNDKLPDRGAAALVAVLAAAAGLGVEELLDRAGSGLGGDIAKGVGLTAAGLAALLAALPADLVADLVGADNWLDQLLGTPLDRTPLPPGGSGRAEDVLREALRKREQQHYGHLGMFFKHFIEGATQLLFADDVSKRTSGSWGRVDPIPVDRVTAIYDEFYTQYYPHEHSDQPPYVWDASRRPEHRNLYQPRGGPTETDPEDGGVMGVVDSFYLGYLAEGLTQIEDEWPALRRDDREGRQRLLVRAGKLLHGVEDWFFHSNVVELLALRAQRPAPGTAPTEEALLKDFVEKTARTRPEFVSADPDERRRLKRRLYRRLRFPAYERGTREESYGRLSTERPSTSSAHHAYPAFPSSADTAHTLLHALGNLETKATGSEDELPPWAAGALEQRGFELPEVLERLGHKRVVAAVVREMRDWIPLVLTLLNESERQRLVANIAPEHWPLADGAEPPPRMTDKTELELQQARHVAALQPHETADGRTESNYEQFARYLHERGFVNETGRQAMVAAFDVDRRSEELPTDAPGCGGFLMQFGLELQTKLDEGRAAVAALNPKEESVFDQRSDNGAFNEIVGSHSLMSKDTLTSVPFFDDARVLASVASSAVFTIMLQQVSAPQPDRRLAWERILHHLVRFPPRSGGWERRALAMFAERQEIPTYDDLPELARLVAGSMAPRTQPQSSGGATQSKRAALEERYHRLESEVARYR
jgi:hypothetical protein